MAVSVRPKIALVFLVVASPTLAIVGHVYRIAVGVRRCNPERVRQGTPDLLGLATGDTEQVELADKLLICVIQNDIEAIIFRIKTGSLILLVLSDVHATPAWIEAVAFLIRHILSIYAFDGFGVRRDLLFSTKIICRPVAIDAAFIAKEAA